MQNILILAIVAVIIGLASRYIYTEKKRGVKCIGCPEGAACSGHCSGCAGNCPNCAGTTK